ncbi:MAG: ribose transport system permease protein [Paraburkholderia sp.]|jgi:ribose transport system permease protein|uniref:ABC transporter permease n=1 Tax=Paraburkholderia sp. TaxID=1926495 RepID=UPI002AFF0590|nr:ABC transporter permease [Paraburkholderia sp.]MEA3087103.1 ribose transport system permease protein [Paraburkholderia sp.]
MKAGLTERLRIPRAQRSPSVREGINAIASRNASALPGILMLLIVVGCNAFLQPDFFSGDSLASNLQNAAPVILVCMAQAVVVLLGELDLSVGAGISLVNCVLAAAPSLTGWGTGATCAAALTVALTAGVCNGVLVGYFRQSALIATFATGAIWFGGALLLMPQPGGVVPEVLGEWFAMRVGVLPLAAVPIIAAWALWAVLQRHRFGRRLIATGSSADAVFKSGVDTRVVKLLGYVLAWVFVFGAALCISAQTSSGDARLGLPYTLNSVAAVVIGGISLAGGRGTMLGAICGALVLVLIGNVVYFAGIPSNYQEVFKGAVILLALGCTFIGARKPV